MVPAPSPGVDRGSTPLTRAYLRLLRPVAPAVCGLGFLLAWLVTGVEPLVRIAGLLGVSSLFGVGYLLASRRFGDRAVLVAATTLDLGLVAAMVLQLDRPSEFGIAYLWAILGAALLVGPRWTVVITAGVIALAVGLPLAVQPDVGTAALITQALIFAVLASVLVFVQVQQQRLEVALRRSALQLDEAQHVARVGSWEWQPDRDHLSWSAEMYRLLGIDPSEPPSFERFAALIDPHERDAVVAAIRTAVEGGDDYDLDFTIRRASGARITLRAQGSMAVYPDGRTWMVGTAHDVSDLRRVEQLQAEFVASASHELRTPTTIVYGFAETLAQRWDDLDDPQRLEFVQHVRHASRRLQRLIEDVLQVSRIETRTLRNKPRTFDVGHLVRSCATDIGDRRVRVDVPDSADCHADPARIEQVVHNLLENARRHARHDITVRVEADDRAGDVVVEVADDGPGVPEEDRARVFDRFVRLQPTASEGTGLGLYISRSLVRLSGGDLVVDTSHLGGASFRFTLPRTPGSAPQVVEPAPGASV